MSATHPASLTVQVPLRIQRRPGRKTVITAQGEVARAIPQATAPTHADPALVKALARAFRYQRLLDEGKYVSISKMAEAERLNRGYMGRLLQLTLLAPDIVKTVLGGRQPEGLDLTRPMESVPAGWEQQRLPACTGSDAAESPRRRRPADKFVRPDLSRPKSFPG
jgi:hypothetical protein